MFCYVTLCYVTLCYVMLCYVMLCYVMLCYVMLSYAVLFCYVKLRYVITAVTVPHGGRGMHKLGKENLHASAGSFRSRTFRPVAFVHP